MLASESKIGIELVTYQVLTYLCWLLRVRGGVTSNLQSINLPVSASESKRVIIK